MATRREQRRAEWEASGAPEAQARLRAALAAAGVDVPDIRASVNGTPTTSLHASVLVLGDELEALTVALERAALPTADEIKIETGNHPRGGFFAASGKVTARGDTPDEAITALRAKLAPPGN